MVSACTLGGADITSEGGVDQLDSIVVPASGCSASGVQAWVWCECELTLYCGSFNGKMNGWGKLESLWSGHSCEGNWADGALKDGEATVAAADGCYKGILLDGVRSGYGVLRLNNGDVYEGEFKNGFFGGFGTYTTMCGDVFRGEWVEGIPEGKCTFCGKDGRKYEGEWKTGQRNGIGEYTCDTYRYNGEWRAGIPHGKAIITFSPTGNIYDGSVVEGQLTGNGKYTRLDCKDVYNGNFVDGIREGWGTYHDSHGGMYNGQWHQNKKEGTGVFEFSSGAVYDGHWEDDRMDGEGIYTYPSGKKHKVLFIRGVMVKKESTVL